jgi:hypothetical protein
LACAYGTAGWRVAACLKSTATLPQQEKKNSSFVQQSKINIALLVQQPVTLAAIFLLRVGVVGSVLAALTQV